MLGPASGRHFLAKPCFAKKENTIGVGFQLRRPPAKQQGRGSQRQPRPSLAYGVQRANGEKGLLCFAEQWPIGSVICSPRRVYISRMQLSEPRLEPWVRWGLGAEFPSWLRENCWGLRPEGIFRPTPLRHEGEHIWSGFPAQETTSNAAGPREPEAAQTLFGVCRPEGRGRKRLALLH